MEKLEQHQIFLYKIIYVQHAPNIPVNVSVSAASAKELESLLQLAPKVFSSMLFINCEICFIVTELQMFYGISGFER